MLQRPGRSDSPIGAGQRVVIVAEQPVSVCRKSHGVDVRPYPDAQECIGRQFGGEFEMIQPLRGYPQADGRPANHEMCWPAQPGTRTGKSQRPVGNLIAVGDSALHEP